MIIGRHSEIHRLRQTILERRSLLIYGKPGAGKTSLLAEALLSVPEGAREKCICCEVQDSPHALLQRLALGFAEAGSGEVLSRVRKELGSADRFGRWTRSQTSLRLRGVLREASRAGNYSVFFDTASRMPDGIYRLLQHWIWTGRTPVVILARSSQESELGRAARLFWHQGLRMELGPLPSVAANQLFEHCLERFGLETIAEEDFREFVRQESGGLPGAIQDLCQMAAEAKYRFEDRIKLHTLRIDFRIKNSSVERPALRVANHG
jgi:hypothetical protein